MFYFLGKESTFYELDDVRHVAKKDSDKNISMSEKMTQTDWQMFDRTFSGDLAAATGDVYTKTTPNGTSPCNHPSLSCQVRTPFRIILHSLSDPSKQKITPCRKAVEMS